MVEHLYPRELVIRGLLDGEDIRSLPGAAAELLKSRLMVAVVTLEEDRLLPSRAETATAWPTTRSILGFGIDRSASHLFLCLWRVTG